MRPAVSLPAIAPAAERQADIAADARARRGLANRVHVTCVRAVALFERQARVAVGVALGLREGAHLRLEGLADREARGVIGAWKASHEKVAELQARVEKAESENARLREALEAIAEDFPLHKAGTYARAALKGE